MTSLPKKATVLGTGGGALSISAELSLAGCQVTLADFPRFADGVKAIEKAGGIQMTFLDQGTESKFVPVSGTSVDPKAAVVGAPLVIISVPCFGHAPFSDAIAPVIEDGQTVMWIGEGGGAFSLVAALRKLGRRPKAMIADSNSLPYLQCRVLGPATAKAKRKAGGTYVAALPTSATAKVGEMANQLWRWVKPGQNAWETLLVNFNAIDHVATLFPNLAYAEKHDTMHLWGDGLSPAVARLIGEVDNEYARLRQALGLSVEKRYEDFLVEQGIADKKGSSVYDTMVNSRMGQSQFKSGPKVLEHRYITEDIPYSMVLASSLGDELSVDTPVIDSLITLVCAVTGCDYWAQGRTLATWGLKGKGRTGLQKAVDDGWW